MRPRFALPVVAASLATVVAIAWWVASSGGEEAGLGPEGEARSEAARPVEPPEPTDLSAEVDPLSSSDEREVQRSSATRRELAPEGAAGSWVVRGRATKGYDDPYPGAKVRAKLYAGAQAAGTPLEEALLECDASGTFAWSPKAPEGVALVVVRGEMDDHTTYSTERSVVEAQPAPTDVVVRLFPLDVVIEGVVRGPEGPIEGAVLRATAGSVETDASGLYRLRSASTRREDFVYATAAGYAQEGLTANTRATEAEGAGDRSGVVRLDFELVRALRIAGLVVDENDAPIQGAEVRTFFTRKNVATTGADGSFVLDHLDPRREQHHVFARKSGFVQASEWFETEDAQLEDVVLRLSRGARVEGHVSGPDGPLAGAELYIGFSPSAYDRLDALSDASGAFAFPNVGAGRQTLVAQYPGLAPQTLIVEVPAGQRSLPALHLKLTAGHFAAGRVVDPNGAPIAEVWLSPRHLGKYIETRTVTDADGRFRVEGLPASDVELELYGSGFVRKTVAIDAPDRGDLEIVVERCGLIEGRVIDARSGAPVTDFIVRFIEPTLERDQKRISGYGARWAREGKHFSSADGSFSTKGEELEAGMVAGLEVRADDYATQRVYDALVRLETSPSDVVIPLYRGASLRGRVVDADGAPVADVKLACRPAVAPSHSFDEEHFETGIVTTGVDGRFELDRIAPTESVLRVVAANLPAFDDGPFDVDEGERIERDVVLPRADGRIEGRVLSHAGLPLENVEVHLHALAGSHSDETRTDGEGAFAFEGLPDGEYSLSKVLEIEDQSVFELQVRSEVRDGRGEALLQPVGDATLVGTIDVEEGEVPEWLEVYVIWRGPPDDGGRMRTRNTLAHEGAFEIPNIPSGECSVAVFHGVPGVAGGPLFADERIVISPGERRELHLTLRRR